ncbi:MAG: glycoside hydrolase family 5 protein [Pseudomonadota bacterium]
MIRAFLFWVLMAAPGFAFPVERCVNLANALEARRGEDWGYTIRDADIAAIAAAGFDTVRLPVRFDAWFDGEIDPAFQARVDHVIRVALDEDLQVILDLHHFDALVDDPAAHGDTFVAIWRELAAHYAGWPPELMFELLNEPNGALTTERMEALTDRVLPIIRAEHPERWVVVTGGDWSAWQKVRNLKRRDDRVAYTFHYYWPFEFTHQEAEWVEDIPPKRGPLTEAEANEITAQFRQIAELKRPLFLGEFGTYQKVVGDAERAVWMRAVREASEAAGIGWCHWGFVSGFRVAEDNHAWKPGLREALFE